MQDHVLGAVTTGKTQGFVEWGSPLKMFGF